MNFLFVNHHANAPAYGNPYRTFSMAKNLVRLGHKVTIVAAGYSHLRQTQPQISKSITTEEHADITYLFLPSPKTTESRASRVMNILGFLYSYARFRKEIIAQVEPDVVVEGTTYILPFFISHKLARKACAKLIYEVRDLWPASPIEISGKTKNHPFFLLVAAAQKYALKRADCVVSTLRYADVYFTENVHPPKAFAYIQNGIDLDLFASENESRHSTYHAIQEIKAQYASCIGYTGGMGAANGLDSLVQSAAALMKKNIAVILIGQGARKAEFQAYAKEHNLTNLYIFDAVPKAEIIPITQIFDLAFVGGVYRSFHRFGSSPNKAFDYMMSATPFLYCINTDDDFIEKAGCGITVKQPNAETVTEAALRFFALPSDAQLKMGENGRHAALNKYEYRILTQSFLDVIDGMDAPAS